MCNSREKTYDLGFNRGYTSVAFNPHNMGWTIRFLTKALTARNKGEYERGFFDGAEHAYYTVIAPDAAPATGSIGA